MEIILEIHLVLAFLAALCAIVFSWNAMGRRVVNAVVALQFLMGLVVAAALGADHQPMPPMLWFHLFIGILVLAAYGMAMRAGRQASGSSTALAYSVVGLVLLFLNVYLGWHMAGRV
ncbi:MAG TPA: hypothetical protein VIK27_12730 [Candidatus Aquilonibacter sp.]